MILFIDTTDFHHLRFAVINQKVVAEFTKEIAFNENYKTNEYLQKFLSKNKVKFEELDKIIVCSGPGSFTGIRVGVSMAQAIGFALKIPVMAIPKNKIPQDLENLPKSKNLQSLKIDYGREPNISKSKS